MTITDERKNQIRFGFYQALRDNITLLAKEEQENSSDQETIAEDNRDQVDNEELSFDPTVIMKTSDDEKTILGIEQWNTIDAELLLNALNETLYSQSTEVTVASKWTADYLIYLYERIKSLELPFLLTMVDPRHALSSLCSKLDMLILHIVKKLNNLKSSQQQTESELNSLLERFDPSQVLSNLCNELEENLSDLDTSAQYSKKLI